MIGHRLDLDDPRRVRAMRACRAIARHRARNFYHGMRLAPEPKRSGLYAMYAWMRVADDLADDSGIADRAGALQQFSDRTELAISGDLDAIGDEPIWVALADTIARFNIDRSCLDEMLAGQLFDLAPARIRTFDQLETYCRQVASTVGQTCVRIWGIRDEDRWEEALELAALRGVAFQLTNILRDIREDFELGRIYLPEEDFESHELAPSELLEWEHADRCTAFMRRQAERARRFYQQSEALDDLVSPDCIAALWAMTKIYGEVLQRIESDPKGAVLSGRVQLPWTRKIAIGAGAVRRCRAARRQAATA
jgi:phytoene synthase